MAMSRDRYDSPAGSIPVWRMLHQHRHNRQRRRRHVPDRRGEPRPRRRAQTVVHIDLSDCRASVCGSGDTSTASKGPLFLLGLRLGVFESPVAMRIRSLPGSRAVPSFASVSFNLRRRGAVPSQPGEHHVSPSNTKPTATGRRFVLSGKVLPALAGGMSPHVSRPSAMLFAQAAAPANSIGAQLNTMSSEGISASGNIVHHGLPMPRPPSASAWASGSCGKSRQPWSEPGAGPRDGRRRRRSGC